MAVPAERLVELPRRRSPVDAALAALRPRQWSKNLLAFAGLVFAAKLGDASRWAEAGGAFAAYCALSSAAYLVNDVRDREHDRGHPVKKQRPIARGELSVAAALALAAGLTVAAAGIGAWLGLASLGLLLAFAALQLGYSFGLKHVVLVDVLMIGGLFVIRAAAGAEAVNVRISPWLLLCTALLALFLALAKRRGELVLVGARETPGRPVLEGYSLELVDQLVSVVAASTVIARGAGAGAADRRPDPGHRLPLGRDRGADPGLNLKRWAILALGLAVIVGLGLGLYADFGRLGDELGRFRWELFPAACGLTALNYLLRFWRWQRYLARLEIEIPVGRSLSIFVAGLTMTISPAKLGEVLKCGLLRRSFAMPVRRSAPVVLAERVTDATGVVVLAVAGGAGTDRWPLLALALAGVVVIVAVVRSPLLGRFAALGEAPAAARMLLGPRLLAGMTAVSAVSWFCECLAAYLCVRGLRLDLSLADTVVVFSLGSLAGALSFLPGGLGVAETSMTGLIRVLGDVSRAGAAAATVLIRLATLWFAVALGLVGLAVEERLARRR